jgi:hypothetical protein
LKAIFAAFLASLACGISNATASGQTPSFKILKLDGNAVRWRGTAAKEGRVVTYAVVTHDTTFAGARNCRKMTHLDGLLATSRIPEEVVRSEIAAAFAMWESVAKISFRMIDDTASAEIVIGSQLEPVGWAFADVFYDRRSHEPVKAILRSLICLNPNRYWKVGFDGNLQSYDIRYTFAHEVGHAIGLDHPPATGEIMGYRYDEAFRDLQSGDIAGAIRLYGKRQSDTTFTNPGVARASGSAVKARIH